MFAFFYLLKNFFIASEDGIIKIWSRSGMLRSTVIQSDESIICARWSPTSNSIVFCQNEYISVKPLAANSKLIKVINLPFKIFIKYYKKKNFKRHNFYSIVACTRRFSFMSKLVFNKFYCIRW